MGACSFSRIGAWAGYDLANTIFAINILSLYFPLWVIQEQGGSDLMYAIAASASLFFASGLMPYLGTLSDRLQRRMIFLIVTTLLCVLATASLSKAASLGWALFLFGLANLGYQLGLIFYDALLPQVGAPKILGKVSGLGVALGYVGTLVGLVLVRPFVLARGYQAAFFPTALFFLLFSLPCFFFVRDPKGLPPPPLSSLLKETGERLRRGMSHFGKGSALRQFLWVTFFAMLAIQPVILFMAVYTRRVMGLSDSEMMTFFFLTTFSAIFGAFICGILTDRWGPKITLLLSLGGWCFGLFIAAIALQRWHFWVAGGVIGAVLGSTWVSSRVLVVQFSSPEYLGEVFGCVGLMSRLAAILGPLIWGGVVWIFRPYFPWNYRVAIFCLLLWMLISVTILAKRLPATP